ncbi:helix-turn-helix transcriptional regulator [uncultured Lactobacillus sp.]|uniref:helix-turn-helix domain-containing protein n=1 Tax=uncultured Lactobacillus sp. TaxID=153152 RepID=UPI0025E5D8A6|nr:helix-turn-helix transcriptional regulator [uncultured Lactobacillus sp.]
MSTIDKKSNQNIVFTKSLIQKNIRLDMAIKIKQLRESMKMSQSEFAKKINKPVSTVSDIEAGNTDITLSLLIDVAVATHTDLRFKFVSID